MHVMMQMTAMLRLKLMKKKPFMIHHWSVRMNCLNKTLSMMKSLVMMFMSLMMMSPMMMTITMMSLVMMSVVKTFVITHYILP